MPKKKKARMGRPPKPRDEVYSVNASVRMTQAEYARLKGEAKRQGATVSELLMRPWRKERQ